MAPYNHYAERDEDISDPVAGNSAFGIMSAMDSHVDEFGNVGQDRSNLGPDPRPNGPKADSAPGG